MANPYNLILFDLGGVLIELKGIELLSQWAPLDMPKDQFYDQWLHLKSVKDYETGSISSKQFAEGVISEFSLQVDCDTFLEAFVHFFTGYYEGVEETLSKLALNYPIACLSNTNEIHWKRLCSEFNFDKLIETRFLSFETGFIKPEPAAFLEPVRQLAIPPSTILYFDDNLLNVKAAQEIGMNAVLVKGFDAVKKYLCESGLLCL